MEVFLVTRNLFTLLLCLPIHGLCALLCAHDARFFALIRTEGFVNRIRHLEEPCHGVVRWAGGDARREP
jgi:type IV secretory pathway VirB3-like protein